MHEIIIKLLQHKLNFDNNFICPGQNPFILITVRQLVARFEEAGTTPDNLRVGKPQARRSLENICRVA